MQDEHLEMAVQREYRKAGAACPLRPKITPRSQVNSLRRYATGPG